MAVVEFRDSSIPSGSVLASFVKLNWAVILGGIVVLFVFSRILKSVRHEWKIQRLGGHALLRPARWPLQIDLIRDALKYAERDESLLFWDEAFSTAANGSNTMEVYPLNKRVIFTAHPDNIKAILATQFNDYGKGKEFEEEWHEFLGKGIFSTDGQLWQDSRSLIRPQFIKDRVSDLNKFEEHAQILISKLPSDTEVDLRELFFRYTLDVATDFLLGRGVDSLNGGGGDFAYAFSEIQRLQNKISRAGGLAWLVVDRKAFRRHLRVLNNFVQSYIDDTLKLSEDELEKRSKSDEGYTFLHALATYTRDRTVLRDQLVAVLLAGRDTTACTLSWLFYELSENSSIVDRLRKEIESVVGLTQAPTYADLKNMKFLQHCLNETLRLYPVVPFNIRVALKDTTLPRGGGPDGLSPIGIPKDTPVAYSALYLHLSDAIYPPRNNDGTPFSDPIKFDPSRWEKWTPKAWTYIPFNGGPRICVGQNFALTEMAYTTVRILQRYSKIESRFRPRPDPNASFSRECPQFRACMPDATLALRMVARRQLKMRCEIVLIPADEVRVAFHR